MSDPSTSRWEQLNESGRLYFLKGDLRRAEEAFRAAVAEAEGGADALRLSSSLGNLAQLRYQQRELEEAQQLFERSIALREQAVGADHVSVSQPLNNLAALHVARGEMTQAQALLARALAIVEKHRPDTHPDVSVTLNNLAKLHFKRGDHAAAEPLLLRLLAAKQTGGKDSPEVAVVLTSLATLRQATGHPAQAEIMWREALGIRERAMKPTDASLAPVLDGLADAIASQGRDEEALALRERALAIREVSLGATHGSVTAARAKIEEIRAALQSKSAPKPESRPAPRMSALQMTALDDVPPAPEPRAGVKRRGGELPDDIAPLPPMPKSRSGVPEEPGPNPWLLEAEPPSHIIDGGTGGMAVIAPPRRTPPFVPAVPRTSGAVPKPVALRNSEVAAATEERPQGVVPPVAAPSESSWFNSAVAPTPAIPMQVVAPPVPAAPPVAPPAAPVVPGGSRTPVRVAVPVAPVPAPPPQPAPFAPAPAAQAAPVVPAAPAARLHAPEPRPRAPEPPRVAPRAAAPERAERAEPPRARRRRPAARLTETQPSSRKPFLALVVVAAVAGAALWMTLGKRPARVAGDMQRGADSTAMAPLDQSISVPAPRIAAPVRKPDADSAARAATTLPTVLPVAPSMDRAIRAIDDSVRRQAESSVKIEVKPPSLQEP